MKRCDNLVFKKASENYEFEQINKLNYSTFVEEIPQHSSNSSRTLVDKFHKENTYFICIKDGYDVVGMVCVRDKRPFSLDKKIEDIEKYIPEGRNPCEIRLLSVKKEFRNGFVFYGLINTVAEYCKKMKYDLVLISGTTRQLKLYRHMGFVPFGSLVGSEGAQYQPMYLAAEALEISMKKLLNKKLIVKKKNMYVNLLPGPVQIDDRILKTYSKRPESHRGEYFCDEFKRLREKLCKFVNAGFVQLMSGSGTLANDAVAFQLSLLGKKGLILSNGEFGERLISHAQRLGLTFISLKKSWGTAFDECEINDAASSQNNIGWLWAVHCETSTGILNDIDVLKKICVSKGIKICLDCISSIGSVSVDLSGIYLATGVSGKALGAYPGISMVFYNHSIESQPNIPRYLDIGYYEAENGIPFTVSSNMVYSLSTAMEGIIGDADLYAKIVRNSIWLRDRLEDFGYSIINQKENSSPSVLTVKLPSTIKSQDLGRYLERNNCFISYRSRYLLQRNWIQCYITGNTSIESLNVFAEILEKYRGQTVFNI
jgi:aspartate aminotransferase-like enzyme